MVLIAKSIFNNFEVHDPVAYSQYSPPEASKKIKITQRTRKTQRIFV